MVKGTTAYPFVVTMALCIPYIITASFHLFCVVALFKDGAATAAPTSPPDPHFKLDETEWLTKERGNTAVSAVLVKVYAA